jgi:CubicO group peptidase (beta-lactamase class C family)
MRTLGLGLLLWATAATAQDLPPPPLVSAVPIPPDRVETAVGAVDGLVADVMSRTGVPGMAVAVVGGGEVLLAKGYGVLEAGKPAPVDADTVFQLASVSKSLAGTVVGTQLGATLGWDTPMTEILPWFALSDPRVTELVTVGDLFAHRSGLPDHAGDDLEDIGYDRRAVLERLRFLPLHGFRDEYAYTNFGLTAAAEAVATASGTDWATLSETAIYKPLGMSRTSSRFSDYIARDNRAVPHMRSGDGWAPRAQRRPDAQSPAGGASSSVNDMAKWLLMLLGDGSFDGRAVVAPEALLPALSPQSVASPPFVPAARAGFYGYGIGVGYSSSARTDFSHSGGFYLGAATVYRVIPSADVGIVVLSNAQPIGAVESVGLAFADLVELGEVTRDWFATLAPLFVPLAAPEGHLAGVEPPPGAAPAHPIATYAGTYANPYFGPIEIAEEDGALVLKAGPGAWRAALAPWSGDSFTFDPGGENAPEGTRSEVRFRVDGATARSVTVEFWDENGLGTFTR